MARTAALLAMLMSLAPLGCATTVRAGLANAPALGGTPVADATVHDVVANGRDSCERKLGPGPLRYEVPPCPAVEQTAPSRRPVEPVSSEKGIVTPWVDHYYSRAACSSSDGDGDLVTLARQVPYAPPGRPLSGLTCWPL
jgi:hypothetical protein